MSPTDPLLSHSGRNEASFRGQLSPWAKTVSHGSAPFIATFLLIHLTPPVLANLGGSSLASQIMLLGREYYQTPFGEKFLVLAPIALHVTASIARRLLYVPPPQADPAPLTENPTFEPAPKPARRIRPLTSLLSLTGHALVPLALIHFLTHRIYPADPSPPIFAVGPAQLDYEYVKTALHGWPVRTWALYTGLVGAVALHWVEGINIITRTWMRKPLIRQRLKRLVSALIAAPVLSGVWFMSREVSMTFADVGERYVAALTRNWVYRF
ncbi:hypothetical protein PUNSTDRAFT_144410 [Punctularia strigosozonata HHB-11173 SS5]|uniref:uncharacterized protein n=1 Tax=Punctularia strigosozonata (strain HHB-11173) TaxID=741275 RepID=UPI0004418403|nr:uncharacterized protein PUNSTDRAFT_144410 [Punctularia strigosozonata HHB-11173 SS5]EIN07922.1 hypothetical protein PUNSTDRAFT_144410 [Punctularia strigosozonata HHB-11173 SS5]